MFEIRQAKLPSPIWMQASLNKMARSKTILPNQLQTCELSSLKTFSKATSSSLDQMLDLKMARYVISSFNICIIHIIITEDEGKAVLQPAHRSDLFISLQTYCRKDTSKLPPNWPSHCGSCSRVRLCELSIIFFEVHK